MSSGDKITIRGWHRTCVFCANTADSKEDIPPRWMHSSIGGVNGSFHAVSLGDQRAETGYGHRPNAKALTLKVVCSTCNNSWMSQLQEKFKPIFERIIEDKYTNITFIEAKTISSWAIMTGIIWEQADYNTRATSKDFCEAFSANPMESTDRRVALFRLSQKTGYGFNHLGWNDLGSTCFLDENGIPISETQSYGVTKMIFSSIGFLVINGSKLSDFIWMEFCREKNILPVSNFNYLITQNLRTLTPSESHSLLLDILPDAFQNCRPYWVVPSENQSGRRRPFPISN